MKINKNILDKWEIDIKQDKLWKVIDEIYNYTININKEFIIPFRNYDNISNEYIMILIYLLTFNLYGKSITIKRYRNILQYGKCFKEKRNFFYNTFINSAVYEIPFNSNILQEAIKLELNLELEPVFK